MFTTRIHQLGIVAALAASALMVGVASARELRRVPPAIVHPAPDDLDENRIADMLDRELQQREPDDLVRVIVSLREPATLEQRAAFEALGGKLRHVYEHVMYGFSGSLPAGEVRGLVGQLGEELNVIRLDQSGAPQIDHSTSQIRVKDWHPFDGDDAYVWTYGYSGDPNSSVAIAGSGITVAHNDLGDSPDDDIEGDSDDWGDPNDPTNVIIGWHDSTPDASTSPRDINGHETLVAGVVAGQGVLDPDLVGVAPDTRLVGLKFGYVYGGQDVFYDSDFIECCEWVLDDDGTGTMNRDRYGIKVLNLSTLWGGDGGTTQAVETLVANGVVVTVSAGNGHDDGSGDPYYYVAYPARSPKVITVGATTTDFQGSIFPSAERITAYSSNGDPGDSVIKPDLVAPGGNRCCSGGSITGPTIGTGVVFTNFGYDYCYDDASSAVVCGPNAPGGQEDFAFQFLATESGGVDCIWIAVGEHNGNGPFHLTVWVANDNNDVPGAQNGGAWNLTFDHAGVYWSSGNGSTVLTAGQRYWLCMAVPASSPAQEVDWYKNAVGDGGTGAIRPAGQSWAPFSDIRSAFQVRINVSGDAYQRWDGTSFAAPHVAGVASLLIQAMEANGAAWQYTESEVMKVKALLQMTATETVFAGQDPEDCGGSSDPQNNTLDRGGKDRVEGYGRMNPDAAVEAATMTWNLSGTEQADLGTCELYKKCWAREVTLPAASNAHEMTLDVTDGADFDLYLYAVNPGTNGEPVIVRSSTTASTDDATNDEQVCISVDVDTDYYVVVKWVEGDGTFTLSYASISVTEICDNGIDDDCDGLVDGDDPDCAGPGGVQFVLNGDFGEGLTGWTVNTGFNPGHPEPQVIVEDVPPMENALHIFRAVDNDGSHAIVFQDPNDGEAAPGAEITLSFDVRIDFHNFGGYDSWNVYPANVWVNYVDELGEPGVIRRSFYTFVSEGHTPDPEPLAEQIDVGVWVHRTYDLSDVSPAIAEITRIQAGSQGWSYDVAFDNVSLLVEQPSCPGDVDGDGDTDLSDLAALLAAYGSGPDDPDWNPAADFDADEDVDLSDLAFLLSDYGCSG
jgi:hypothetical protein